MVSSVFPSYLRVIPANTAPGQEARETLTRGCRARVQVAQGAGPVSEAGQAWGLSPGPRAAWLPLGGQCQNRTELVEKMTRAWRRETTTCLVSEK